MKILKITIQNSKFTVIVAACLLVVAGCNHKQELQRQSSTETDYAAVAIPEFNADSAYSYVEAQLGFGFRTPGSKGWQQCADYLVGQMQRWCDTVIVQSFSATLWDGSRVPGRNIIASLNPEASRRVLLAAHWDSRLWADHDPDDDKTRQHVPGANDGASGVAALMEMARGMSQMRPSVGVDFIFFDVEDQGQPEWVETYEDNTWCKGSQYWAVNRHIPYYSAVYGVLFDMVGTHEPRFTKEEVSRHYAPAITNKVWNTAAAIGYGNVFIDRNTDPILDDHLYVNQMAGIPMVDIVQNSPSGNFFAHWHTTTDDLQAVSAESLKIVATVTLKTIYGDYPNKQ